MLGVCPRSPCASHVMVHRAIPYMPVAADQPQKICMKINIIDFVWDFASLRLTHYRFSAVRRNPRQIQVRSNDELILLASKQDR